MSDRARLAAGAVAVGLALLAIAFVAAPHSCEGGTDAYAAAGVVAVLALGAWPFVAARDRPARHRVVLAFALAMIAVAVWVAGLFLANVRIVCRLF